MQALKLYVWDEWRRDYSSGVCVVLARNKAQAKRIAQKTPGSSYYGPVSEPDRVILLNKAQLVCDVYGGG